MSIAQPRNVTIIDNVISRSRVSDVVLVLVGVVLTALAAQVVIHLFQVVAERVDLSMLHQTI